jgi:hypothetical protein
LVTIQAPLFGLWVVLGETAAREAVSSTGQSRNSTEAKGSQEFLCELFLREACDPKSCKFLHTAKNHTLS